MLSRKSLPVVLLFLCAGLIVAFRSLGLAGGNPPTKEERILHNIGEMLSQIHYSPKKIDDNFSKDIFQKYLAEKIDPLKNIFLKSDIDALRKFETRLDDEILGGNVEFVPAVGVVYKSRIEEAESMYKIYLSKPFDFTVVESVSFNPEQISFPTSLKEKEEAWRKRMKYLTLERYADLLEIRNKNKSKDGQPPKTDAQLEEEARGRVLKIMDRSFSRLKIRFDKDDAFNDYVNTITETMDPHTAFFPPPEKRYFDEQMSGRFFGIGASLVRDEEGNIKIATLITGSPAWKSGQVNAGDIILKVGQGNEEPVDLTGFMVEDAVKIIRGKKGAEVRLYLRKSDGSLKTVSLIRDEIVQDETFARSTIINDSKGKIGYIYLPEFYADFEDPKGARCSEDVRKEIIRLKEQKVNGIIMDLRNNGGGSLYDVVQMVGLFIEEGPIVQVKDRDGKPQIYRDRDKTVLYDGPLGVMVNEFSASASEIFAAAIQDYNRGVIIGSTTTYGKGTVQRNIGLDKTMGILQPNSDLGTIKLTLQKFYRINGGSTQLKGVSSDVLLPDVFEYSPLREKNNPDALPWDEIQKADYTSWRYGLDLKPIIQASKDRVSNNESFSVIKNNAEWLSKQNDKVYTLNLNKYKEEQQQIRNTVKQIDSLNKLPQELDVTALNEDLRKMENDTAKLDRFKSWVKNLRSDIYLDEAVRVVNDMIVQDNLVYNNKR
ncbi:MAG: carboxy terminal-processing peptidase [Chitinophagaceae bacterium]|nr:carboxy terminal-processing peptidase [Chitinophagaceae bacterium]